MSFFISYHKYGIPTSGYGALRIWLLNHIPKYAILTMSAKSIQESTRYDRQIRVWGAEAQFRLQNAQVLLINFLNLNVEVAKNLVLAGVHVTVADDHLVTVNDLASNFFLSLEDVGRPIAEVGVARLQDLNTFVTVHTLRTSIQNLDTDTLQKYDVILLSGGSEQDALRISEASRNRPLGGGSFFWSDANGDEGIFFADFGPNFQYAPDPQNSQNAGDGNTAAKPKTELQSVSFPSLSEVLAVPWSKIPSRHQPLSKTFVEARIIHKYRDSGHGNVYDESMVQVLGTILDSFLTENGLNRSNCISDVSNLDWNQELHNMWQNQQLGSILTVSMLGSFLSQEVIKVISRTGKPGSNVFTYDGDSLTVRSFPIAHV